jgi:hypothetical protein
LQAILQHESATKPLFQIEGDVPEAAHVEEGFVLNFADARVVQIPYVHKGAGFRIVVGSRGS